MQWGPKFNYGHYDENLKVFPARKYVIESIHFWVEKFHIDGIRFDATRAIANFDALRELTGAGFDQVDGRKPFLTVAEHVPEDPAITGFPDGPMVAAWRFSLGAHFRAAADRAVERRRVTGRSSRASSRRSIPPRTATGPARTA